MSLVEHNDAVFRQFFRYAICDLRIQQVMIRVDDDVAVRHHSACCKVRTLLLLLAVLEQPIEREDTRRDEVVWLEKIKVLMVHAELDVFATLLLLFYETSCKTATSRIHNVAALFTFDAWVQAEILSTRKAQTAELLLMTQLLRAVLHQGLQFSQGFLNLRHSTRAVDKLSLFRVKLLICNNEGE